ncbi:hypothetical protein [Flexithrix dorotheae]|uniref:hypothetical protein n=1 Tax=Flexithrix dorotheae TaxID=70993 RepID=UPI000376FEEC|nr:hypothetical protein [Flexithrix dorotheae]
MNPKRLYFLLIILQFSLFSELIAQGEKSVELNYSADQFETPGVSLRYQHSLKNHIKINKKGKEIEKMISLGIRYSWYHRKNHHSAHILSPYIRFERKSPNQIIVQSELGLGYFLRKQENPTYKVVNGELQTKQVILHRIYPYFGLGIGYNFNHITGLPVEAIFRPNVAFEIPNNTGSMIHMQMELGLRYIFQKHSEK